MINATLFHCFEKSLANPSHAIETEMGYAEQVKEAVWKL